MYLYEESALLDCCTGFYGVYAFTIACAIPMSVDHQVHMSKCICCILAFLYAPCAHGEPHSFHYALFMYGKGSLVWLACRRKNLVTETLFPVLVVVFFFVDVCSTCTHCIINMGVCWCCIPGDGPCHAHVSTLLGGGACVCVCVWFVVSLCAQCHPYLRLCAATILASTAVVV